MILSGKSIVNTQTLNRLMGTLVYAVRAFYLHLQTKLLSRFWEEPWLIH